MFSFKQKKHIRSSHIFTHSHHWSGCGKRYKCLSVHTLFAEYPLTGSLQGGAKSRLIVLSIGNKFIHALLFVNQCLIFPYE